MSKVDIRELKKNERINSVKDGLEYFDSFETKKEAVEYAKKVPIYYSYINKAIVVYNPSQNTKYLVYGKR